MSTAASLQAPELDLVDIVDFKWLMAGTGRRVHVEHMQADPAYALDCVCSALQSPNLPLRALARRLARRLSGGASAAA